MTQKMICSAVKPTSKGSTTSVSTLDISPDHPVPSTEPALTKMEVTAENFTFVQGQKYNVQVQATE